jgi:hypothetical protein
MMYNTGPCIKSYTGFIGETLGWLWSMEQRAFLFKNSLIIDDATNKASHYKFNGVKNIV